MSERVLIISAIPPRPVDNGKRMVLNGLLTYFVDRLGPENVHYALLGNPGDPRPEFPGVAHRLDPPSTIGQLSALAGRLIRNPSYTAQEAMLGSAPLRKQIHDLIAWIRPTIEVYDTLRLAQHAPASPRARQRVLYLDDLFSLRYERMLDFASENEVNIDPLGEFASNVPAALRSLVRRPAVYRRVLSMERDRIRRREVEVVREFDKSLLVNEHEVEILRKRAQCLGVRHITGLLPEIDIAPRRPAQPPEIVFLGRLNIPHNDDGICAFLDQAMPELVRRIPMVKVRLIGRGASDHLHELAKQYPENVHVEGFVPYLEPVFARAIAAIAPLRFGTGIKIKVLDALARGVPVVSTGLGVDGLSVRGDRTDGCLVEDDLSSWPELIEQLSRREENSQFSKAARAFFDRNFGRDIVMAQYDELFELEPKARNHSAVHAV